MGYNIATYFLLFLTYAVGGWILEVTCKSIEAKKFINRGFLIGPYCPIYGFRSNSNYYIAPEDIQMILLYCFSCQLLHVEF